MKHATNKLILAIKPDTFLKTQEINLMTLYSNNCKKIRLNILLKQSKKANHLFFLHGAECCSCPSPSSFLFPSSSTILLFSLLNFFYSLLDNFIIFPPQCFQYSLLGACKLQCVKANSNSKIKNKT